jgi:MFS family permease
MGNQSNEKTVVTAVASRLFLVAAALVPFVAPPESRVGLFTLFMILFFLGGAFSGCSTASLIKDLLPEKTRGSILASRLSAATALGAVLSLAGGFGLEPLKRWLGEPAGAYAIIFLVAAGFGLVAAIAVAFMPEPRMRRGETGARWLSRLIIPVKDPNFRKLLVFSGAWSFTVIMSGAFFAVYILDRIGIPMIGIILLAMLSQVANIYFFRVWGRIADHFSNKSVLAVTVPLFIVILLMYPFTTMPERYGLTIPLLVIIHIIGGISTAGFNLCAANIALRLAPHGNATSYLGTNAFCAGLAAAIAPLVGGALGYYFANKEISIDLFYRADVSADVDTYTVSALSFRGLDFVFFASALTGLYAWHRLSLIDEEGTVSEKAVRAKVFASVRNSMFTSSGLNMGMRRMTAFPYDMLRKTGSTMKRRKPKSPKTRSEDPKETEPPSS